MRHGKKFNHLGRTSAHRKALLSNMANSLILKKRIKTTVAKAKELRKYVEPLITKAKSDTTHNRRVVFSYLQDKESIKELFNEIGEKVAERNGGYTRIIKLGGTRLGDNADVAVIELVDYNEAMLNAAEDDDSSAGKTRRRRRKGGKKANDAETTATESVEVKVESKVEEAPQANEEATSTDEQEKDA